MVNDSQRRAARIAGLTLLLSLSTVIGVNYCIFVPMLSGAEPAQAARNILAHQPLFRVGLVGNVIYSITVLVLAGTLYVVLKPVGRTRAFLAALCRMVQALVWIMLTLNLFTALKLLSSPDYARLFDPDRLPMLARLYLSGYDHYYVGLVFWGLASGLAACLWFRSRYISHALSAFGILASAWAVACTIAMFLFPGFSKIVDLWLFDMPLLIFEVAVGLLLLFRGLRSVGPSGS